MARYIDADALIAEYDRVHVGPAGGARKLMVDAPTADVAPKSEGEWVYGEYDIPHCSECGFEPAEISPYCPHCGAKMEGGEQK